MLTWKHVVHEKLVEEFHLGFTGLGGFVFDLFMKIEGH